MMIWVLTFVLSPFLRTWLNWQNSIMLNCLKLSLRAMKS
ncbi:hypothetical protein EVA_11128 [gut metagenome]|uniref:Uncharacterized protein n=1 Tax=gut metagenome TaxID=749906 RepID=J9GLV4_9ZZZZ